MTADTPMIGRSRSPVPVPDVAVSAPKIEFRTYNLNLTFSVE